MSTEATVYEVLRQRRKTGWDDGWCSFPLVARLVEAELDAKRANSTILRALGRLTRIGHLEQQIADGPGRVSLWRARVL